MGQLHPLLPLLADGGFHSGEELAAQLGGVSRAAVWKAVQNLTALGLDIQAVRGRGYRLAEPLELLEPARLLAELDDLAQRRVTVLEVYDQLDSTNTYLLRRAAEGRPSGAVCLAETQSAGRGRQGRPWVSPFAANLYLSLLWRFAAGPAALSGLSLAVGIAVARTLDRLGVTEAGLKWPNDLLWRQRKLGGILLEFGGESGGPCQVVTGIGLNVAMPRPAEAAIDQPWVDLRQIVGPGRVSRHRLATALLSELVAVFTRFEQTGFTGFQADWQRFDLTQGKPVRLTLPASTVDGIARGVDDSGALLLETADGVRRFLGGEISLRLRP
jgi:BirA family biotin operon repressor/biotin-[acetyl-CoA-carboxylase] ligase